MNHTADRAGLDELTLIERLHELSVVTTVLGELSVIDIHDHVEAVRSFLHDDVLIHANEEELRLFPVLDRMGAARVAARLAVEHDTVRGAAAELDDLAGPPLTADAVRATAGVLRGIEVLLESHLDHESDAALSLVGPQSEFPPTPLPDGASPWRHLPHL